MVDPQRGGGRNTVAVTVLVAAAVAIGITAFLFGGGIFVVFAAIPIACIVGIVRNARNPDRPS